MWPPPPHFLPSRDEKKFPIPPYDETTHVWTMNGHQWRFEPVPNCYVCLLCALPLTLEHLDVSARWCRGGA